MRKIGVLVLIFIQYAICFSQELKVQSVTIDTIAKYVNIERVLDVNNEPCSLVKVITSLQRVDFFSNRGIEKVEKRDSIFWVWIPKGTSSFKIGVPGFPLLEFDLPRTTISPNLFIVVLKTDSPQKIVYKDTLAPVISISSKPSKAEVFINGAFQGVTPLDINIPFDTFSFSIKKNRYLTLEDKIILDDKVKNFSFNLKLDPYFHRWFIIPSIGVTSNMTPTFGASIGKIGKTGWYCSGQFSYPKLFKPDKPLEYPLIGIDNEGIYVYTPDPAVYYVLQENYKRVELYSRLSIGITQQIFSGGFIYLGTGLSLARNYVGLTKFNYTDNSVSGEDYAIDLNETYDQIVEVEAGLIYRVGNHFLLNFNWCINKGQFYSDVWLWHFDALTAKEKSKYAGMDFSFGLGYNF